MSMKWSERRSLSPKPRASEEIDATEITTETAARLPPRGTRSAPSPILKDFPLCPQCPPWWSVNGARAEALAGPEAH
jgi:hypothetical protein